MCMCFGCVVCIVLEYSFFRFRVVIVYNFEGNISSVFFFILLITQLSPRTFGQHKNWLNVDQNYSNSTE